MASQKDVTEKIGAWKEQGWEVTKTNGSHLKFVHPLAKAPIFASSTPSDWRSVRNIEAMLKRALRPVVNQQEISENIKKTTRRNQPRQIRPTGFRMGFMLFDDTETYIPRRRYEFISEDECIDLRYKKELVHAWAYTYMILRNDGRDIGVIRALRMRFKKDKQFRTSILVKFRKVSRVDFDALRLGRRQPGRGALEKPLVTTDVRQKVVPIPRQAPVLDVQPQRMYPQMHLDDALTALDNERRQRETLEEAFKSYRKQAEEELVRIRTQRNHAYMARDDMAQQLATFKDRRMNAPASDIEDVKTQLDVLNNLYKGIERRIAALEGDGRIDKTADASTKSVSTKGNLRKKSSVSSSKSVSPPVVKSSMGERIRDARMKRGLSQVALGEKLRLSGATISLWENERMTPSDANVLGLAKALKVTESFLRTGRA